MLIPAVQKSPSVNSFFSKMTRTSLLLFLSIATSFITSCKDDNKMVPVIETSSMTDVEGNVYKTVKIGSQWWMAENLNVTKYKDGQIIESLIDNSIWNDTIAGFCSYPGAGGMGKLYNWYALNNASGLAPEGWHIPSDEEWKQMEVTIGMSAGAANNKGWRGSSEGDALKATGIDKWFRFGIVWASNSSGFTALAASCRIYDGTYGVPGLNYTGFWWTSSDANSNEAWYRYLDYKQSSIFRSFDTKRMGCSVRCVKNN